MIFETWLADGTVAYSGSSWPKAVEAMEAAAKLLGAKPRTEEPESRGTTTITALHDVTVKLDRVPGADGSDPIHVEWQPRPVTDEVPGVERTWVLLSVETQAFYVAKNDA